VEVNGAVWLVLCSAEDIHIGLEQLELTRLLIVFFTCWLTYTELFREV